MCGMRTKIEWILLKDLLMGGARGSRIVVTTRSIKVAKIMGTTSPHELKGLAPEKAWSLFVKIAFKEGKETKKPNLSSPRKTDYGKVHWSASHYKNNRKLVVWQKH